MITHFHRNLVPTIILLFVSLAAPATGQVITETANLTAPNASSLTDFGLSIAIDGDIIAVGASKSDPFGAVYLFDSTRSTQTAKIVPADGSLNQRFGFSVAMSDGIVAVGSPLDIFTGDRTGSAYLFDRDTSTQLFKLLPNDIAPGDFFGQSIDIDNGLVVVGAHLEHDNGFSSGSAYVFDAATGLELTKLLPEDGADFDHFGNSVAIHNGLVVVGADHDDDNGDRSGSAYVFDAITGVQIAKLTPGDGADLHQFGFSVDIFDGIAAITALGGNSFSTNTGAAYLFDANTGEQLAKLQPDDNIQGDGFGTSIVIDSTMVAVGVIGDDENGSSSGSVYLFDPTSGVQFDKIHTSEQNAEGDQFGRAIAVDNGVLAASAITDDDNGFQSGSAYAYTISTGTELAKLLPADGTFFDNFGISVALDDEYFVVGAHREDENGPFSGSAYVYSTSTRELLHKLVPDDGAPIEFFGISSAINDDIVVIGAHWDDDNGLKSGSVYLFDAITGEQLAKLLPEDGAPEDWFGISVDIDDGIVVVGSWYDDDISFQSGSAYLFDAETGAQIRKLLPDDGALNDYFGISVAINDGIVAVGARNDDDAGINSGSAYLFDAATGVQLAKLLPDDGQSEAYFGSSIDIENGTVVVGAIWADQGGEKSGAAYLFNAKTGTQITSLIPDDLAEGDRFGSSVRVNNNTAVVGSMLNDDRAPNSGSAYLFDAITGDQISKLLPSTGSENARFGSATAIDDGIIVSGAYADNENGWQAGAIYIFDTNPLPCPADFTGDRELNFFDVSLFLSAFISMDPAADLTGDGLFNFHDISVFIAAFSAGCS